MKCQDKGFDSDYYRKKHEKKRQKRQSVDEDLEGEKLHDLYRHSTKLIK
ncbi:MAG: hypothetical protein ACE5RN_07905 [Nitrosopumilaceae archaeon]